MSHTCNHCGAVGKFKKCGWCWVPRYCSVECQAADYNEHKSTCGVPVDVKAAAAGPFFRLTEQQEDFSQRDRAALNAMVAAGLNIHRVRELANGDDDMRYLLARIYSVNIPRTQEAMNRLYENETHAKSNEWLGILFLRRRITSDNDGNGDSDARRAMELLAKAANKLPTAAYLFAACVLTGRCVEADHALYYRIMEDRGMYADPVIKRMFEESCKRLNLRAKALEKITNSDRKKHKQYAHMIAKDILNNYSHVNFYPPI